ncbi:MAG: cupredoxin domain-containing protein [Elusimicrobiota bacterium]|nr:cupredoxin domain-containing protein [Elusimicrobiota bacterium]
MKGLYAVVAVVGFGAALAVAQDKPAAAPVREFKSVNIEVKGQKIWVPGTFIVKKGDKVKITLINTAPSGVHAFAIEGYEKATTVSVNNKEGDNSKTVEFTADTAGLFRVWCPMHAPHVGGQLLVLE